MIEAIILLIVCSFLATRFNAYAPIVEETQKGYLRNNNSLAELILILLWIILILFAGLRTTMNDTHTYLMAYEYKVPDTIVSISEINLNLGSNPLYECYRIIVKSLISKNGNVFLTITAIIVVTSYISFLKKYSVDFGLSIYLLLSFTVYAFALAAIKQTLATSIAIWAIPNWINKKKIKAIILIILGMLIHPYVAIYFVLLFLTNSVWDRKTLLVVLIGIIAILGFSSLISFLSTTAETFGDYYSFSMLTEGNMSIYRIAFYMIIPLLSFNYRNAIRTNGNEFTFTIINSSIVSAIFALIASVGGANLFGRMANYFDLFLCISLPIIINTYVDNINARKIMKFGIIVVFAVFYFSYYNKYLIAFGVDWSKCLYEHTSFLSLFK